MSDSTDSNTLPTAAASFGNIAAFAINPKRTSRYVIGEIRLEARDDGRRLSPVLIGLCANEKNRPFRDAAKRANAKRRRGTKLSNEELLEAAFSNARELFPGLVITGWEDVFNVNGDPVAFSADACREFLRALPDWILQGVIEHFGSPANFTDADQDLVTEEDIEATVGN